MSKKVFCLGVWDLLHEGHRALLKKASRFGDLYVGIVGDEAVQKHKGADRPIINEGERSRSVYDLKYVKDIVYLDDFSIPQNIIYTYDYIIVGEDQSHITNQCFIPYHKKLIFPRYVGISTSQIIERIKKL